MANVYYNPEQFGLEVVFEKELSQESYSFDTLVVWRHVKTGKFYVAQDSGCSCPSPFEGFDSLEALEEVNEKDLSSLVDRLRDVGMSVLDICELIESAYEKTEVTRSRYE